MEWSGMLSGGFEPFMLSQLFILVMGPYGVNWKVPTIINVFILVYNILADLMGKTNNQVQNCHGLNSGVILPCRIIDRFSF